MGKYRTIVADPPWDYSEFVSYPGTRVDRNKEGLKGGQRRITKPLPYEAMSIEEICALPIGDMADRSAVLWLWTTSRYLPDAFQVIDAWGFRYKQTLVWHKHTAPRVELFARRARFGWDYWGDQSLGTAEMPGVAA